MMFIPTWHIYNIVKRIDRAVSAPAFYFEMYAHFLAVFTAVQALATLCAHGLGVVLFSSAKISREIGKCNCFLSKMYYL